MMSGPNADSIAENFVYPNDPESLSRELLEKSGPLSRRPTKYYFPFRFRYVFHVLQLFFREIDLNLFFTEKN